MSDPIKLNLWVMPNAGFDTQRVMQRELSQFKKENPEYEVRLTVIPWFFAWDRLIENFNAEAGVARSATRKSATG